MTAFLLGAAWIAGCHYHQVPPGPPPLTAADIIRLSKEGKPPDEIIDQIRATGAVYLLDAKDVIELHESGVDEKVINYMLDTQKWDIENRSRYHHHHYCDPYGCPYHVHWGVGWHVW